MLCDVTAVQVFINAWNAKIINEGGRLSRSCIDTIMQCVGFVSRRNVEEEPSPGLGRT